MLPLTCPVRARHGAPVQRLVLELPAGFDFRAGQYIEVLHPEGPIPLSIASAPHRLPELHLHYRSTPGVTEAAWMDALLAAGEPLQLRGPFGAVIPPADPAVPLVLIAAGTGITQVCALLDDLAGRPARAPVTVLWCVDLPEDLYCEGELEQFAADWLSVAVHVAPAPGDIASGMRRISRLAQSLTAAHGLADADAAGTEDTVGDIRHDGSVRPWILLAGSPGFVHAAADVFTAAGIDPAWLQSDVFAWAPRPKR